MYTWAENDQSPLAPLPTVPTPTVKQQETVDVTKSTSQQNTRRIYVKHFGKVAALRAERGETGPEQWNTGLFKDHGGTLRTATQLHTHTVHAGDYAQ